MLADCLTLEPRSTHGREERRRDGIARGIPHDGVDAAARAQRGLVIVDPFCDLRGRKPPGAVETAAESANAYFNSMLGRSAVCVVQIFVAKGIHRQDSVIWLRGVGSSCQVDCDSVLRQPGCQPKRHQVPDQGMQLRSGGKLMEAALAGLAMQHGQGNTQGGARCE